MAHNCQGSCSQDHHEQSHSKHGCCCGSHHCSGSGHHHGRCAEDSCHHQCKYAEELLCLADEAWMEVLKEKIKEEIRLNAGEQLTQMAKLVSTANHARWKDKLQGKKDHEDFENRLKNIMGGSAQK